MESVPILRLDNIHSLLSQLVSPHGAPHTALLISRHGGAVLVSSSSPTEKPFPKASLEGRDDDERGRIYAAVAGSAWEERVSERDPAGSLYWETELGRMAASQIGAFLLVLIGTSVSPWPVLEKKTRLTEEVLKRGLKQ